MERADEDELTGAVIALASEYDRYGYKKIAAMLQSWGWKVGRDRVERIFCSLKEAGIVIEQWRQQYNRVRPHTPRWNPVPRSQTIM